MRRVHVEGLILLLLWVLVGVFGLAILSGMRREQSQGSVSRLRETELPTSVGASKPSPTEGAARATLSRVSMLRGAPPSAGKAEGASRIPTADVITYVVKSGDNLSRTAERYGMSVDDIARASGIENRSLIFPGQVLVVPVLRTTPAFVSDVLPLALTPISVSTLTDSPAAGAAPSPTQGGPLVHTVQPGDTLYSIARRYGTTIEAIIEANSLSDPRLIQPGQRLLVASGPSLLSPTSGSHLSPTVSPTPTVTARPSPTLTPTPAPSATPPLTGS